MNDHKHFCVDCEKVFNCRCLHNADQYDFLCYDCREPINYGHRERVRLGLADLF